MKRIYKWYTNLSKRLKDSFVISVSLVGCISTFLSIIGISLADIPCTNIIINSILVMVAILIITIAAYIVIGRLFKDSIELSIRGNSVTIKHGDIFKENGYKIIGCDSHFDTRVDDIVITKLIIKTLSSINNLLLSLHSLVIGKYNFCFVFAIHFLFGHSKTCICIIPDNNALSSGFSSK